MIMRFLTTIAEREKEESPSFLVFSIKNSENRIQNVQTLLRLLPRFCHISEPLHALLLLYVIALVDVITCRNNSFVFN